MILRKKSVNEQKEKKISQTRFYFIETCVINPSAGIYNNLI